MKGLEALEEIKEYLRQAQQGFIHLFQVCDFKKHDRKRTKRGDRL